MNNMRILLILAGLFLLIACVPEEGIQIHNAWVRPTAQGENAAVYLTLHNHFASDDELIGVSSNVADTIEIHEGRVVNDVAQMNLISSLPIAGEEEVIFAPGGSHIMLVKINREFILGEHIGLILHFKHHEDIVVEVHIADEVPEADHEHESAP